MRKGNAYKTALQKTRTEITAYRRTIVKFVVADDMPASEVVEEPEPAESEEGEDGESDLEADYV